MNRLLAFGTTEVALRQTGSASYGLGALLDALPIPVLFLAADREILTSNVQLSAESAALECLRIAYGRVCRFAGRASESFDDLFAKALCGCKASAVVTVAPGGRRGLWRVHCSPLWSCAAERTSVAVMLLIEPPCSGRATAGGLQRLFSLTSAEARVLALLVDDCRPLEIASALAISVTTVRSHLTALFAKTGTRRQTELVALALSAA